MSVITGLAIGSAIVVFGSAGLAAFAIYLSHQDDKQHRGPR
ncbi:hypothetical protein CDEF62S_05422 [Castellaniella defragrans]